MEGYRQRIMDGLLTKKLQTKGAVLIEGPKWCGKTTTAEEVAASKVLLAKTDVKEQFTRLLEIDSDAVLSGEAPMLIDEWQTVPKLWDAVRYTIDHRRKMGQFILTGSAVPDKQAEQERVHSGTGRFAWLTMRPMTLFESGESNGSISLKELFNAPKKILGKNALGLKDIAFLICRGGWPMAVELPEEAALEQAFDYYDAVTKEDISKVDGVKRASHHKFIHRSLEKNFRNRGHAGLESQPSFKDCHPNSRYPIFRRPIDCNGSIRHGADRPRERFEYDGIFLRDSMCEGFEGICRVTKR